MFTPKVIKVGVALAALCMIAACGEAGKGADTETFAKKVETPNLGMDITHAELAAWDIDIGPDGAGLPPGGATAKQGAEIYREKCAVCHGMTGEGKPADRLVGGVGSLAGDAPVKTVASYWPYATTLFDFVRRSMPLNEPQSLSNDEVYAVSAHILHLNGLLGEDDVLNAETLPKVQMPNRDGFTIIYPGNLK
jgi:mono/diheme cytochrome c family protein